MKNPETKFKERVVSDLKTLENLWFYKTQEVAKHGILDIIMCLCGLFVAIELKKDEYEKPSKLQMYNRRKIQSKGKGIAYVAYPENWDSIFASLKEIDESYPVDAKCQMVSF